MTLLRVSNFMRLRTRAWLAVVRLLGMPWVVQ